MEESTSSSKEDTSSKDKAIIHKEEGNNHYKNGNYDLALKSFNIAIDLDPSNEIFYCNRSMCYSAMNDKNNCLNDAKKSVELSKGKKYVKSHYRLVKACIDLNRYKDASFNLLNAFKECGENKELQNLEKEILQLTGLAVRPRPNDFDVVEELGDGNFSKIVLAKFKPTGVMYAIKTIEKMTAERMKRRHPNIDNEIMMEKRALNKLSHPNIVTLHSTFQDYGTLYYQMEYLSGGELWSLIKDDSNNQTNQVGCHWSLIPFIFAEAINGLEYMHKRGIVHRDIKPENILFTADGHIKFVDFGTAKDLFQTDLNGPEFVGTPEYMSPSTINSKKGKGVGPEADLWSLGVVLYQLYLGVTAFHAASPYLIFLKVKRGVLKMPPFIPEAVKNMIQLLLEKDDMKRLENATGIVEDKKIPISYDKLRCHPFFTECGQSDFSTADSIKEVHNRSANKIPSLKDLCIRAVGLACIHTADIVAENGGYRPDVLWIQDFDISKLQSCDRSRVAHFLNCKHKLHIPGIYRLFWNSIVDAKCIRVDSNTRDYIGYNRALQGEWYKDFFFAYISGPEFILDENNTGIEVENLRRAIASINKLRPRFVVSSGNCTNTSPVDPLYEIQLTNFRKNMARLSESIAILYVAGDKDVSSGLSSLQLYRKYFGADYYGFWYGGLRCLIINSSLFNENLPMDLVNEAVSQEIWLEDEIEQAKLCSQHVIIFMHTPWFVSHIDEEYQKGVNIPYEYRVKWLNNLRHSKVKYVFASGVNRVSKQLAFAHEEKVDEMNNENQCINDNDIITDDMKPSDIIAHAKESGEILNNTDGDYEDDGIDEEEEFLNNDPEYFGPNIISTPYISNKVVNDNTTVPGIRLVVVKEDSITQKFYNLDMLPEVSPIPITM